MEAPLLRIVRMKFRPEALPAFEALFAETAVHIRNMPGCLGLRLCTDAQDPDVRYTYSLWASADALEAYRLSALFAAVWPRTKALFAAAPAAFSLVQPQEIQPDPQAAPWRPQ
jgi:quinol monooxygenase YgiN